MTNGIPNNLNHSSLHDSIFAQIDESLLLQTTENSGDGIVYNGLLNIYDPSSTKIVPGEVVKNSPSMILKDNLEAIKELNKIVLNSTIDVNGSIVKSTILYKELQKDKTELDMSESVCTEGTPNMLTPTAMLLALQICATCPTVTKLSLAANCLQGYALAAAAIIAPSNIATLDINNNEIGKYGPDFATIIATSNITDLDVGTNQLERYGPTFVTNLSCSKIHTLNIGDNLFGKNIPKVAFQLTKLSTLKTVIIDENVLSNKALAIDTARSIGLSLSIKEVIICTDGNDSEINYEDEILEIFTEHNKKVCDHTLMSYIFFLSRSTYSDKVLLKLTGEKAILSKEEATKVGNNIVGAYLPSVLSLSAELIAEYVEGDIKLSGEYLVNTIEFFSSGFF